MAINNLQINPITQADRHTLIQQTPFLLWFTGLCGSGKTTLANSIEYILHKRGTLTYLLDGDIIRTGLNTDLSFDDNSRKENVRRLGEISNLLLDCGVIVLVAAISPFQEDRDKIKKLVGKKNFIEIYVDTPFSVCESRDKKGLYKKARNNEIKYFTGISSPYEPPINPNIHIKNDSSSVENACNIIISYLETHKYI